MPLGWYFAPQWERWYDSSWPEKLCDNWIKNDRYLKNFAAEIFQCPCTLEHALVDRGRFLPDADCDRDANPQCLFNKGAVHCVTTGAPSMEGSEQQCCYDKNNYLMLSYDQQWGSRPRRSHNLGFLPWTEANKVRVSAGGRAGQKGQLPRARSFWGPRAFHRINFNLGPHHARAYVTRYKHFLRPRKKNLPLASRNLRRRW